MMKNRNIDTKEESGIEKNSSRKIYKSERFMENMITPGDLKGLPDDFFKVAVFIDNAYLIRLKNYFFKEKFKYSLKDFILKFSRIFREQGIVLREGRTQRLKICDKFLYKQKGVDMLLGIDAISAKSDFPEIAGVVLLTGDSDFSPLVEKLKKLNILVFLWTYFDRNRQSPFSKSNYLIKSVGKYFKLTKENFLEAKIKRDDGN